MIPGIQNDDKWRMVEDEFVAVAHKFTAHLHAAEYQRLKERVKRDNSDAIRSLSRLVSGPMTENVKKRHAALLRGQSQYRGIKRASGAAAADELDGDEMSWAGTNLRELMNSPRKKPAPLATLVSNGPGTRAAALQHQSSSPIRHSPLSGEMAGSYGGLDHQVSSPPAQSPSHGYDDKDRGSAVKHLAQHAAGGTSPARIQRPTQKTSTPHAATANEFSSRHAEATTTSKPTLGTSGDRSDSDSSIETFFDRRMRERRAERKTPKRKQP